MKYGEVEYEGVKRVIHGLGEVERFIKHLSSPASAKPLLIQPFVLEKADRRGSEDSIVVSFEDILIEGRGWRWGLRKIDDGFLVRLRRIFFQIRLFSC